MKRVVNIILLPQRGNMSKKTKNIYLLILIIITLGFKYKIENPMESIISPKNGDYISPIVYGLEKKDTLLSIIPSDLYYQIMATNFSYISDYKNSLKYWDIQSDTNEIILSDNEVKTIKNIKLVNASDYIKKRALNEKIIMFNEAHHNPINRVFVSTILKDLRKNGYTYLALETLNHYDVEDLNKRKYILQKSGTYLADPVFSSMVNYALKLGYKLVAYENQSNCKDNSLSCRQEREINQANNLAQIFSKDKNAKVIVLAGYDHIIENNSFKMMAQYFKEQTNINPLTVDQVELCEKSKKEYEHPIFRSLSNENKIVNYSVATLGGMPFVTKEKEKNIDIQILSPRISIINSRPNYLINFVKKVKYSLYKNKLPNFDFTYILIQAFNLSHEDSTYAIPSDQFLLSKEELAKIKKMDLYLEKGEYLIKIKNNENNLIYNEKTSIN